MNDDVYASLWGHIEALRTTLLKVAAIIAASAFLCFLCSSLILSFLQTPLHLSRDTGINKIELFTQTNTPTSPQHFALPAGSFMHPDLSSGLTLDATGSYTLHPGGRAIFSQPAGLVLLGPLEGFAISMKVSFW